MNMREIARLAGVSSATVSRVINGSSLVTEETTKRIRAILDEVGFIPNPHATTLKYGRSKTFGLIIPDICNPFYADFLGAFEHLLGLIDHEVLFTNVETDKQLLASVRRMLTRQVDGVVLMASESDTRVIEQLLLHKIPLVTVDRRAASEGVSDVSIDFESGFLEAVALLKHLGHTKLGFIGGFEGLRTSDVRLQAFRSALQSHELRFHPEFVRAGNYRVDGGEAAVQALWTAPRQPTALLTANDLTAFGAMRGLQRIGKQVPTDVSVVGVDDVLLAGIVHPGLTTVRVPRAQMARTCLQALQSVKEDVTLAGSQWSVPTQLIVRESTAPPRR